MGDDSDTLVRTKGITMQAIDCDRWTQRVPRKGPRQCPYDTNLDEPAKLLQQEGVDLEEEIPAEDNESVERPDAEEVPPLAFEE
jgi:hypothetical protein